MSDWVTEQSIAEARDTVSLAEAFAVCAERIPMELENSRCNTRNDTWITRHVLKEMASKLAPKTAQRPPKGNRHK
jgi:hypothetical protein